jgi:EAL domain-containing protein (putative c-di-GMP-specific phosphodiesterase class I)
LDSFVAAVNGALKRNDCDPEWVEIEITEHSIVRNFPLVRRILGELSLRGVSIAIDDFGAGYSSLAHLAELPANTLKIDRGLIEGIDTDARKAAIMHAVVALARALGLALTAEGVEEAAQARFLERFGCVDVQGFLFGRPMPAESILACGNPPMSESRQAVTLRFGSRGRAASASEMDPI